MLYNKVAGLMFILLYYLKCHQTSVYQYLCFFDFMLPNRKYFLPLFSWVQITLSTISACTFNWNIICLTCVWTTKGSL